MKSRLSIAAVVLLLLVLLVYCFGFIGNSFARIRRDQSIALPVSTSHIRCGQLFSLTFTDVDVDASFEVASNDLPAVLSQFRWETNSDDRFVLSERMKVPDGFVHPSALQRGWSHDGNCAYLQWYDLGRGRVGICIYTIWN